MNNEEEYMTMMGKMRSVREMRKVVQEAEGFNEESGFLVVDANAQGKVGKIKLVNTLARKVLGGN
jgi:hypothetical protein